MLNYLKATIRLKNKMANKCKYTDEQLHEHFDCYDLNKNGEISWSELLKAIKRCSGYGDEEVETMARVKRLSLFFHQVEAL